MTLESRPSFDEALSQVEAALGHRFADRRLARRAFLHRSFMTETNQAHSYERLEFLGDAVLQLAVTHRLFEAHPDLSEGEMAKVRAAVVNEKTLARVARDLHVPEALLLGRGEELTGGRQKDSILSDVVESLFGALYLETGFERACRLLLDVWGPLIEARAEAPGGRDYKTRLQEHLAREGRRPVYEVAGDGPEHAKHFTATVVVDGQELGSGSGTSKKRAEQEAARSAYTRLAVDA